MSRTDEALLRLWTDGRDAEAFNDLVERHGAMVFAACRRILGNAADAEEVTQECFLRLAQRPAEVRRSLGGWLHRLATSRSLDRLRADRQRRGRELRYAAEAPARAEPTWDDIQRHVDEAIAELPARLREPLVRHFLLRETHGEIAKALRLSRPAVTHRIERGIEAVRGKLRRRGIAVGTGFLAALLAANLAEAAPLSAGLGASLGRLALAAPRGTAVAPIFAGTAVKVAALLIGVAAVGGAFLWRHEPSPDPPQSVATQAALSAEATPTSEADAGPARSEAPSTASVTPEPEAQAAALPGRGGCAIAGEVVRSGNGYLGQRIADAEVAVASQGRTFRTRSLADGSYRIEGLPDGEYRLMARTDSLVGFYEGVPRVSDHNEDLREYYPDVVWIGPAGTARGTVRDSRGQPVAGARVMLWMGHADWQQDIADAWPVRTNADGRYAFDYLPADAGHRIEVSAEGFAPALRMVKAGTDGNDVVLGQGAAVSGRVTHADTGAPVADVTVRAYRAGGNPVEATTDADGRYRLQRLAGGSERVAYRLEVESEAWAGLEPVEVRLGDAEVREGVDIRVSPGAYVSGRVTAKETGKGLAGVSVSARTASQPMWARTWRITTGPDGLYRLGPLPPGKHEVFCVAREGIAYENLWAPYAAKQRDLELTKDGEVPDIDFRLEQGVQLAGRVRDAQGRPAPGARVALAAGRVTRKALSGPDGTFRFTGLPRPSAPVDVKVVAQAEGSAVVVQTLEAPPEGLQGVEIRLAPESVLAGRVVDTEGVPAPYARVRLQQVQGQDAQAAGNTEALTPGSGDAYVPGWFDLGIKADARGNVTIRNLGAGVYRLLVDTPTAGNRSCIAALNEPVELAEGQRLEDVAIVIPSLEKSGIAGVVRDEEGRPLANVPVRAAWDGFGNAQVVTDEAGRFVTGGMGDGPCTITIAEAEMASDRDRARVVLKDVPPGTRDIEVVLERVGTLSGTLVDAATGRPLSGSVCVLAVSGRYGEDRNSAVPPNLDGAFPHGTAEKGVFRLKGVTPGTVTLSASADGYATREVEGIVVGAGRETSGIRMGLFAEGVIEGRVTVDGQAPTAAEQSAVLFALPDNARAVAICPTVADGLYRFEHLPPGEYEVSVSLRDEGSQSLHRSGPVTVEEGQTVRVDIEASAAETP